VFYPFFKRLCHGMNVVLWMENFHKKFHERISKFQFKTLTSQMTYVRSDARTVFDQLWGANASVDMKKAFISLLRALAKLARERLSANLQIAIPQSYALRETVNNGFNNVRALTDGVLFEFGPTRQQDLTLRHRILGWQPQLRMLFVSCVALLKYRLQLPGFELPEPVRLAQQQFEGCLARTLDGMADRVQGRAREGTQNLEIALARLRDSVRISGSAEAQGALTANMKTFLPLFERITGLAVSLAKEIGS